MALPAGRKGVLPSELTPEGKIKNAASPYVLPIASANTLGGVKVGNGLSITDGVLSADGYTLPAASDETLGGVKVGEGLSIDDGVLSASGGALYRHVIATNQYACKWFVILTGDSSAYTTYAEVVQAMQKNGYYHSNASYAVGCGRRPAENTGSYYFALNSSNLIAGYDFNISSNEMTEIASVSSNATITDHVSQIV